MKTKTHTLGRGMRFCNYMEVFLGIRKRVGFVIDEKSISYLCESPLFEK